MQAGRISYRRARRTDFTAIVQVLGASGLPTPAPDRPTLRRFRRLIADLGTDLYIAEASGRLVGFVHLTYVRDITVGTRARMEALVVSPDVRRRGIGSSLTLLARRRGRRRGCHELLCSAAPSIVAVREFLAHDGWQPSGEGFCATL